MTRRPSWPWMIVILGATLVAGAAVHGMVQMKSVGTGVLDTTPLGGQIAFTASGSYRANIFTPRPSRSIPGTTCRVTTTDGRRVELHDAAPYTVNTRYDMESSYGIHVSAGTTYLITCGQRGDEGSFAVVEFSRTPRVVSFTLGAAGLVIAVAGGATIVVRRRRRRTGRAASRAHDSR